MEQNEIKFVRYDEKLYDGRILIEANHRRGIWACELSIKRQKASWTAGRMTGSSATVHSLLAAGLISALRSIPWTKINSILAEENRTGQKLRLLIVSRDPSFGTALDSMMHKQTPEQPLRAGKQLLIPLARALARFQVEFRCEEDNNRLLMMRNWSNAVIPDARAERSLTAIAAGCLAKD